MKMRCMKWLVLGIAIASIVSAAEIPRAEHPRPDFRRDEWMNLNGVWEFRFDPKDRGLAEQWWQPAVSYDRKITVPFCWESKLSGIHKLPDPRGDAPDKIGWYRRQVTVPAGFRDNSKRVWLRFGAVDWRADVWVNGKKAGQHEGGYTPFEFDITDFVEPGKPTTVVVRAFDETDPELPTGKQVAWYTPTSGIWQTVWLEARPVNYIAEFSLVPRRDNGEWSLEVNATIQGGHGAQLIVSSPDPTVETGQQAVAIQNGSAEARIRLKVRDAKMWTPDTPHLYDLTLRLESPGGATDTVHSYFGLRTIGRGNYGDAAYESVLLNGKPVYLRGALDQSFNPEGVYTAPSDEFMRHDMELAKSFGLNFLRIHIKVDEPRRLYWADRVGVLIMEDMPSTRTFTLRGQKAWEAVMRGAIPRDRNHPSILAWCLFNETWGLDSLKERTDIQNWVLQMWEAAKELDSTRLVDDNSPNKLDHVATDLNSFHFYLDDPPWARAWINWVVRQTFPGSPFLYVPGRGQDGAPLINSEYGAVSAAGGDRDVSWGFRSLTTQLRRHEKIQGYVYTELTDIEWEHNGLANYDRSVKESGYDAFIPGMDTRDLQGADFVGYDAPPAIEAKSGSEIAVPVFVSHYSTLEAAPVLRWWITGWDDLGGLVETPLASRPVSWEPYRVTVQQPVQIRIPTSRPFAGALALELLSGDKRIAANFVNLIARPGYDPAPRVEVLGPREVALRFGPDEISELQWKDADRTAVFPSKFYAWGSGLVLYRLALPDFVREARPVRLEFLAELASKAQDEKLDWPARRRSNDYPQTDGKKHRGLVTVGIAGEPPEPFDLPDDPADSRGVLSNQAGVQNASYGFLLRRTLDLASSPNAAEQVRKGTIEIRFQVPEGANAKGLSIYGERMGRYPMDPTVIVHTARDLK
jgi:hypothetical protein